MTTDTAERHLGRSLAAQGPRILRRTQAADYLLRLIEQGFGDYHLKLGTRGIESLRPDGRELDLCLPDVCAETAHDGRKVAYLRACDGN